MVWNNVKMIQYGPADTTTTQLSLVYYGCPVGQAIIFCCYDFFFFLLFFPPVLRLKVYHTYTHDVALVQM